ncbi:MAG: VCBS repeat-containing protein [Verrucomicrobia bacterium]|nr:VCBS repeat-containing protein [Verrucomicrobiota bacterium]
MHNLNSIRRATRLAVLVGMAALAFACKAETLTNRFGFTGPEIFPIDNQISQLHSADLDGDGLNDLIVVNNVRSKINLLYNQTGSTNTAKTVPPAVKRELNELPLDARFRVDSIASEKRIASLVVEDLNQDGRPDIAYYGEPKELVVQYNQGTNGWSAPKRWAIDDGQLTPNALTTGDLNGDHLLDLLLLSENYIYLFTQKPDHTLGEPEKIPFSGALKSAQVLDIDGDGRDDLLLVNWENPTPFRFRLQNDAGQLGPEIYFALPPIRSYWADILEKGGRTKVMTIAQNSGRAQISEFVRQPAETLSGSFKLGQFQVLPINRTTKARRGMLWADINGDGLPDLLVSEPDSGQITVFFQKSDGTLAAAKSFPTLTGVSDLAVADWDGNGRAEIFLLSTDERQVGVTRLDEKGRLPFPTLIPMEGKPLAMAVGPLQAKARATLAVLLDQDGSEQESKRVLFTRTADGKTKTQKLSKNFKSNPSTLAFHDVNQDGLADLIVLIPYEKIKILLQVAGKDFEELDIAPPGGSIELPWLSAADVDGDGKPELLLTQKNFLRAVVLKPEASAQNATNKAGWMFSVKEQINGAGSNSRLVGAAAVPNGTNAIPSLFLLDAERKVLTLCERDTAGVWQVVRNISLPFTEFTSLQPVALGGTNLNTVGFLGLNAAAWLALQGDTWEFKELDGYETPIKDGHLNDVVTGDLNNDGRKDLVFLETAKNYLDLVLFEAPHQLVPANRWQVFEERTFRSRRSDMPEPREALVTDVTGDGKNDLVVLVHDRILVYPQE